MKRSYLALRENATLCYEYSQYAQYRFKPVLMTGTGKGLYIPKATSQIQNRPQFRYSPEGDTAVARTTAAIQSFQS
jgi:thiamine pyrophosphokinase